MENAWCTGVIGQLQRVVMYKMEVSCHKYLIIVPN